VGVSTEPRRADLPLPGGRTDATVRLHPLLAGEMLAPPGLFEKPEGRMPKLRGLGIGRSREDWIWIPVPAFLVEHPSAGPILIDTGLHPSVAIDPRQSFGGIGGRLNEFRMKPEQGLQDQLRARGVEPADVSVVVMTHLHWDHASGVSEFPHPTFIVDRREWDAAIQPRGYMRGYRTQQFDYGFHWRFVDYSSRAIDSFAGFGASIDLFGDGSVRLLATPGHTLGHQSVLLRLRDREALLTADAAYLKRTIDESLTPLLPHDEHKFFRSLKEVQRYIARTPAALVIPGHDRDVWPTLAPVYE
jgi:N-acyl homoserine lactone hydrolase